MFAGALATVVAQTRAADELIAQLEAQVAQAQRETRDLQQRLTRSETLCARACVCAAVAAPILGLVESPTVCVCLCLCL